METLKADAVFEGGGVKGIGLVGALFTAEQDYHVEWQRVAGTSAGAVVAALVAAGYTANEIYDIIKEKVSFAKMMDRSLIDRIPLIGPAVSLGFEKGIFE